MAEAGSGANVAASSPAEGTIPRRASRDAERSRGPATAGSGPSLGAAEPPGRLLVGQALQVAEDDGRAVSSGKAADSSSRIGASRRPRPGASGAAGSSRHARASPPGRLDAGPHGDPPGDPVEPRAERVALADRPGLADQDEERRLEGVLRVVRVAQHAAADPQDHRPVPAQDSLEGRLVPAAGEPVEELPLADSSWSPQ